MRKDKIRLIIILLVSLFVIITGMLYLVTSIRNNDFAGAILGLIIAVTILGFAVITYKRGNKDLKEGYPLKDERSVKVMEKATSKAFLVSLYVLLVVGFLSENTIKFRDVSQATSVSVGLMGILFLGFWLYYNRQAI